MIAKTIVFALICALGQLSLSLLICRPKNREQKLYLLAESISFLLISIAVGLIAHLYNLECSKSFCKTDVYGYYFMWTPALIAFAHLMLSLLFFKRYEFPKKILYFLTTTILGTLSVSALLIMMLWMT